MILVILALHNLNKLFGQISNYIEILCATVGYIRYWFT